LRNVIVHKSAIADAEYVRKAKDLPTLPQLNVGERVQLHGKAVADLIHQTALHTLALFIAVDHWLTNNAIKADADGG
jgi:hypothetical protein